MHVARVPMVVYDDGEAASFGTGWPWARSVEGKDVSELITIDYDAEGNIIGVEVAGSLARFLVSLANGGSP